MIPKCHPKIPGLLLAAVLALGLCRAAPRGGHNEGPNRLVQAGATRRLTDEVGSLTRPSTLTVEGRPASQPLTLKAYAAGLDRWLVAVNHLKDHPEKAARLCQQLPPAWVVLADGQRFEVSTEWLRSGLETFEKDRRDAKLAPLRARLEAMRQDAQALAVPPPSAWQPAHEKLREILARREFRGVHSPTWIDLLNVRLNRWLAHLLNRFSFGLGSHPGATRVVLWVFMLIAAGSLLVWMVRRLLQRPRDALRLEIREAPEIAATWQQMLQEARAAAGRGDSRDAIRRAYWAGIMRLEDLGLWTADGARTHREYLRLLSPGQPQLEPLAALTRQFERAWYAGLPASAEDFQTVLSQVEKL